MIELLKNQFLAKIKQKTTINGIVLMVAGISYLVLKPIAVIVAYAAILYGAWIIWQSDS